jgi:diaminopimelate decarboxylase
MSLIENLIDQHFARAGGELLVGDCPITALAARHGTPLFVHHQAALDRRWDRLRAALPREFAIYYSVKANPALALLRHFLQKGAGLEIASGGECHLALRAGCPPARIIFAGPGKTDAELEMVLKQEIGEIHVESMNELDRISSLSVRLGKTAGISLRINPGSEAQGGAMRMGGKPAAFGIDEEQMAAAVDRARRLPGLALRGVHLFAGTQILDHTILLTQYRKGIEIANTVAAQIGRPLHTLDFGGGLGIPYFPQDQPLDLLELQVGLERLMAEVQHEPRLKGTRFVVEPGRFLIGESGVYVARVTDVKVSRGKRFVILDGGMHHHLAASGNLGQTIKRNFPLAVLNKLDKPDGEPVTVAGPLCTPLDTIGREVTLPDVEVGDLVGVFQAGAYTRSASPVAFLSHPTPPELLVAGGNVQVIRRRGTYDDLHADMA